MVGPPVCEGGKSDVSGFYETTFGKNADGLKLIMGDLARAFYNLPCPVVTILMDDGEYGGGKYMATFRRMVLGAMA